MRDRVTTAVMALTAVAGVLAVAAWNGLADPDPASSTSASAGDGATAAAGPAPGSSQVAAAVRAFYEQYSAEPSPQLVNDYLTPVAATRVLAPGGDTDRVLCAQNTPASLSFAPPARAGDDATVLVTTHWTGSTDRTLRVTVTLPDVLISDISCPTTS